MRGTGWGRGIYQCHDCGKQIPSNTPREQYPFCKATVVEATDSAIQRGLDSAHIRWRELALKAVHQICLEKETFTADDVRRITETFQVKTHDTRAAGGIMRVAKKNGWCETTGDFRTSDFTHGHMQHIWKSNIYQQKKTLF